MNPPAAPPETPRENIASDVNTRINGLATRLRNEQNGPSAEALMKAKNKDEVLTQLRSLALMAEAGSLKQVTKQEIADLQNALQGSWEASIDRTLQGGVTAVSQMGPAAKNAIALGIPVLAGVGLNTVASKAAEFGKVVFWEFPKFVLWDIPKFLVYDGPKWLIGKAVDVATSPFRALRDLFTGGVKKAKSALLTAGVTILGVLGIQAFMNSKKESPASKPGTSA